MLVPKPRLLICSSTKDFKASVLPNKQRVNIFLDGAAVEHFKSKAGDRGYQTLINEAHSLEGIVRRTIREELRRA